MLWDASAINGYAIEASDGRVGTVSDLLFEDVGWAVRWLVVDTGNWLSGRKVLLPRSALGRPDRTLRHFSVKLTMEHVKDSPDVDTDLPVSQESNSSDLERAAAQPNEGDAHLCSIATVTGYRVHATDGEIGHVDGFLVDDTTWSVRYIIVDTRNWKHGENVLISSVSIREIDWVNRLIRLDVDREKVKGSPTYDPSITVDRAYEEEFLTYYGIRWLAA